MVDAVLATRVQYYVDSHAERQGTAFAHTIVRPPSALEGESEAGVVVLIASMYEADIRRQIAALRLKTDPAVIAVASMHEWAASPAWWRRQLRRYRDRRKVRSPVSERKILLVGGYGAGNLGDEAQLSGTLKELKRRFPGFLIKVLTPTPHRTHLEHGGCLVGEAPRQAFYDLDRSSLYGLARGWTKLRFLARSWWLLLHAWLVRAGVPIALVRPRRMALLHDLATARLVLFVGGGYLTGDTLSRLWDGLFLMRMARVLRVPTALSGQTIGVWNSRFTRRLARTGFECADVIATRDAEASPAALAGLGLRRPRVFATCDDALFLDADTTVDEVAAAFERSGLDARVARGPYVVLNAHFWGVRSEDRGALVTKLLAMVDSLRSAGVPALVGVPMLGSDAEALLAIERARPDGWFRMLRSDDNVGLTRAVIRGSYLCVSMKHHPIVFALGEKVPAISLTRGAYYAHKNLGALGLVGLSDYGIDLARDDCRVQFDALYRRVAANRAALVDRIANALPSLAARRRMFFDDVEALVERGG